MTTSTTSLLKGALAAAVGVLVLTGSAMAEDKAMNKTKLSEEQCERVWKSANPDNKDRITESQARSFISDVGSVNKDKDGTIERAEFMRACDMGLVKSSATTGEGGGTSGSSSHKKQ